MTSMIMKDQVYHRKNYTTTTDIQEQQKEKENTRNSRSSLPYNISTSKEMTISAAESLPNTEKQRTPKGQITSSSTTVRTSLSPLPSSMVPASASPDVTAKKSKEHQKHGVLVTSPNSTIDRPHFLPEQDDSSSSMSPMRIEFDNEGLSSSLVGCNGSFSGTDEQIHVRDHHTSSDMNNDDSTINSTNSMITGTLESLFAKYPNHFPNSSLKLQDIQSLLSTATTTTTNITITNVDGTSTTSTIPIDVVDTLQAVLTDMLHMQQRLVQAELHLAESHCTNNQNRKNHNPDGTGQVVENAASEQAISANATGDVTYHDGKNCNSANQSHRELEQNVQSLEDELRIAQTTIQHLKTQKLHIISNTKKKKVLYDEMERKLGIVEKEIQIVTEEKNVLQTQLHEMKDLCDTMKQKLRNQQEIVKDSKTTMMEMKQKLMKTEHMRSLENELLDNFRKLAIHTGYYRWGKPIRLLEVAIAAAAAEEETTYSSTDQDFE